MCLREKFVENSLDFFFFCFEFKRFMQLQDLTSPRRRRCNCVSTFVTDVGSLISLWDPDYLTFVRSMECHCVHLVISLNVLVPHVSVFAIWHDDF